MGCLPFTHRWKPLCRQDRVWMAEWGVRSLYSMWSGLRSIGRDPGPMPPLYKDVWKHAGKACTRCGKRKHERMV